MKEKPQNEHSFNLRRKFSICGVNETHPISHRMGSKLVLNAIASFLCVTPQQLSRIRKAVTFSEK